MRQEISKEYDRLVDRTSGASMARERTPVISGCRRPGDRRTPAEKTPESGLERRFHTRFAGQRIAFFALFPVDQEDFQPFSPNLSPRPSQFLSESLVCVYSAGVVALVTSKSGDKLRTDSLSGPREGSQQKLFVSG